MPFVEAPILCAAMTPTASPGSAKVFLAGSMRKRWETAGKMVRKCWENEDYLEIEGEHAGMMWIQWNSMGLHGKSQRSMAEKIIELNDRQLGYQYELIELEPKLGYDMISIYNFKHIDTLT